MPRSAEWDRVVPGRGGGAFKLLYYHCNTTKIDRSNRGRLVVPKSAEWDRVVPGGGGADIEYQ